MHNHCEVHTAEDLLVTGVHDQWYRVRRDFHSQSFAVGDCVN
jgi:hypothetical protein